MKSFLRSTFAAVSLGSFANFATAQDETLPMVPPVQAPSEEPPGRLLATLPIPQHASEPGSATNLLAKAVQPKSALGFAMPAANWVPAASGPKPAPAETVQWAVSEKPVEVPKPVEKVKPVAAAPLHPLGQLAPLPPLNPDDSDARPEYLPAVIPAPTPPKSGALLSIPTAPIANSSKPTQQSPPTSAPDRPGAPTFPVAVSDVTNAKAPAPDAPSSSPADRVNELVCDPVWRVCPQDSPLRFRGWVDAGYVYNSSNPGSKFNGPYNSIDRSAEPMFNQAYGIVERVLPTDGSFGVGFRADVLFGYDHFLGQSRGFEVDRDFGPRWNGQYYGLAIPQVYSEFGNDVISLKLGHFYSPVGYEVLPSVGNFFYSHAYSYQFGQPFTFWGGLLTTQLTQHWQVQAGLVNGWDALVGRANNINFVGSLKYTPDVDWWWSSFALVSGQNQNNPAGLPFILGTDGNRTRYSFLFGLTPGGSGGRWEYVFHHYYGFQENGTPQRNLARWYGIDQYLYYRVSNKLRWGGRFEWFRDEDGTRVGLNRPANPNKPPLPGNYFSFTAGFNYTPTPNFIVRPELRWDFTSDTARRAFNDGKKNNQLLLGFDVIWQF